MLIQISFTEIGELIAVGVPVIRAMESAGIDEIEIDSYVIRPYDNVREFVFQIPNVARVRLVTDADDDTIVDVLVSTEYPDAYRKISTRNRDADERIASDIISRINN